MVSDLVAPSPKDPSRNARGTWVIMSSDKEETKAIIMIPITRPAVRALVALISIPTMAPMAFRKGPIIIKANTPYTIVGIPANTSMVGLAQERNLGDAYSAR